MAENSYTNKGNNHKGNGRKLISRKSKRQQRCLDPIPVIQSLALLALLFLLSSSIGPTPAAGVNYEDHIQRFSIHSREDCADPGEFYTSNIKNLMLVSELAQCGCMKCFCVWHGMWIFTTMRNYQRAFTPENIGMNQMANPGKICESRKINWHYIQLASIRHVGHVNDSLPGLSLFRDTDFFGRELYLSAPPSSAASVSLAMPLSKHIKSYGLTGRKRWTIFSNTNFTGNSTCLTPIALNSNTDSDIKAEAKVSLMVGSIQSGCVSTNGNGNKRRKFYDQDNLIALYKAEPMSMRTFNGSNSRSSENQQGSREPSKLVFDGEELRLTSSTRFRYYSVIGSESWTIYSGTEYNGKCECIFPVGQLDHTERKRQFTGLRLNTSATTEIYYETMPLPMKNNGTRLVGSMKKGCFHCKMPYTDPAPPFSDEYNDYSQEDDDYDVMDESVKEIMQFASEELYNLSGLMPNGTWATDYTNENGTNGSIEDKHANLEESRIAPTPEADSVSIVVSRMILVAAMLCIIAILPSCRIE